MSLCENSITEFDRKITGLDFCVCVKIVLFMSQKQAKGKKKRWKGRGM